MEPHPGPRSRAPQDILTETGSDLDHELWVARRASQAAWPAWAPLRLTSRPIDPDPPDASSYSTPYSVVLLFTESSTTLAGEFKTRYGCTSGADTRPDFDPYSI